MPNLNPPSPCKPDWLCDSRKPKVMLVGAGDREHVRDEAVRLQKFIPQYADLVHVDLDWKSDLSAIDADFAIVLGGDGSLLAAARSMGTRQVPVVGVNMGKLGFLAEFSQEELCAELANICSGKCAVIEHMMFRCRVFEGEDLIAEQIGLNEAAILGGPPFQIQSIDLYVDSELATTYNCDGLIVSTPVGSTAHNLSAGGPILRADLHAFVVSPISPHTLTVRPVVDTAERTYEIRVTGAEANLSVVVDGRVLLRLTPELRVVVDRAEQRFKRIATASHNYYRTLREKLGWGGRIDHGR
ncbi:NAD(+)/NADH kinase [Blastopirellula sp. JC732]|uniref:NAD kinase n=1 Tax=Blastopirellula sediminis TaxID=2894196 RepID=A0A9X1MUN3_9BACT|nr:NAD(+)/NADH kinase [Blastopirellula sediminis]MCC9604777.1 NAD(+)/NADH kinase [Blastopirellula sediminis]MCC9631924.1 NAD(+)/NADH kinase [Blastopirellula sediminis]